MGPHGHSPLTTSLECRCIIFKKLPLPVFRSARTHDHEAIKLYDSNSCRNNNLKDWSRTLLPPDSPLLLRIRGWMNPLVISFDPSKTLSLACLKRCLLTPLNLSLLMPVQRFSHTPETRGREIGKNVVEIRAMEGAT